MTLRCECTEATGSANAYCRDCDGEGFVGLEHYSVGRAVWPAGPVPRNLWPDDDEEPSQVIELLESAVVQDEEVLEQILPDPTPKAE